MVSPKINPRPIFIIGSGRSGTSALTWSLGQHSNIFVCPETPWLATMASNLKQILSTGDNQTTMLRTFDASFENFCSSMGIGIDLFIRTAFENFRNGFLKGKALDANDGKGMRWLSRETDEKERWVDGTPAATPYSLILSKIFPRAKFVHLLRYPDDVFKSWAGISWRAAGHADPLELLTHIYHSQRVGYLSEAALQPERVHRVHFADLISNPSETLERICAFIGEEVSAEMAETFVSHKINHFARNEEQVQNDFQKIMGSPLIEEMREWFMKSRSPDWQILSAQESEAEMRNYEKIRIKI